MTATPTLTHPWTARQREVLDLLARGCTNPQIAERLGISLDGAKWHVSEVITRLGVDTREEAADYWRAENGLRRRLFRVVGGAWPAVGGMAKVAGATAAVTVLGAGVALAILALRGDNHPATADVTPSASAQPATPTSTVQVQPSQTPSGTGPSVIPGTGIASLDDVISALQSGDPARLKPLLGFVAMQCTNAPGLGGPPKCLPGVAEGTTMQVLPTSSGERGYIVQGDEADALAFLAKATTVAAVYRQTPQPASGDRVATGPYVVVTTSPVISLNVNDGKIILIASYAATVDQAVAGIPASDFIIPPAAQP